MIECPNHGQIAGYIVCTHVLTGTPAAHLVEATTTGSGVDDLGEVLCAACIGLFDREHTDADLQGLKLVCAACLKKVLAQGLVDGLFGPEETT